MFADEAFAGAFGKEGRPGWSPGRLALITVLQRVGNLTDRQAAEAVATDLTWKYALGLNLDDPGFDASVLSEFRPRVIAHELEESRWICCLPRCRSAACWRRAASSAPTPRMWSPRCGM
ncbi:transposase [Nonomuraea sp. NPDC048916]|uniref:transposase n=1 Tax=Nonomuraea sp. NPDC048916 TaxID=3154232 RepID=UPI0033DE83CC